MKKILLALDIGNVCVRIDHRNFPLALRMQYLPDEVRQIFQDFECGIFTDENDVMNRTAQMLSGQYSVAEIKSAFNSILIEPIAGMNELAADFEKLHTQAVFFSDISPTHLERTRELFPSHRFVTGGIYSFESGGQKPSDLMFDRFEKLYGTPDIYVDDRIELIEAARKRHWNATVFTGAEDLREKIIALS